ncbi:IS66 family insertion sequence element accessory protein TnpA [Ruminococcus albus]|uniref:Transposase n=1 Tax=Ruminococcus albus (strain ATCC 27210 / DSM 20455 / JCM 14654 / NCDO 2250 / 7) TaxID=697329 RepID=E6UHA2_RUMA7|nr:hypothetical protein [Ruminococcus albus]ADU23180.1 hypothetical protein Rumal_2708 [Ruminococcus albus 7 = DSM 20455]
MQNKTTEIATIRQAVRLQEWTAQIEAQQASGLTIRECCKENGIKPNTYYNRFYRLIMLISNLPWRSKYARNS